MDEQKSNKIKKICISILSLISTTTFASLKDQTVEKIDDYHNDISGYLNESTEYIDEIIGDYNEKETKINKSYAIINIKQDFNSVYNNENNIDFKFKAHLPYTEDKWNFFIDTNSSDFNSLEDKIKESFVDENSLVENARSSIAGFIFDDTDNKWKKRYRLGVKFDFPLDPFFKINIYNTRKVTESVEQYFNQEFFIYEKKGFGVKSNLNYTYVTENSHKYESNTYFQYLENDQNEIEASQQFSKWHRVNEKGTLKSTLGFSSNWTNDKIDNNYWVNTRYRHRLHDNWLYGKVIPEISFNKSYDYKPNYGILFQLELFFAKDNNIKEISNKE